jgi:small subunit ribosomal protein S16
MGRKGQPHYRIVVSDSTSPRDGRFVETLGYYKPLTDPARLVLDIQRVDHWLGEGASPSGTVKSLISKARRGGDDTVAVGVEDLEERKTKRAEELAAKRTAEQKATEEAKAKATEEAKAKGRGGPRRPPKRKLRQPRRPPWKPHRSKRPRSPRPRRRRRKRPSPSSLGRVDDHGSRRPTLPRRRASQQAARHEG